MFDTSMPYRTEVLFKMGDLGSRRVWEGVSGGLLVDITL